MAKTTLLKSLFIAHAVLASLISMSKSDPLRDGFSIDLIHRDSLQSPSYDPSLTPFQRIHNALQRSFHRVHRFKRILSRQFPESYLLNSGGEYIMIYFVGTPPFPSLAIADTGSDLIWTQCLPCLECIEQILPLFQPRASSTYKRVPCNSSNCNLLDETFCNKTRNNCLYNYSYGDNSFTQGELATDIITLASSGGKRVSASNIVLGCGFRNGGIFSGVESGIVGLGLGNVSLVRQLGPLAQGKFSYCLVAPSDNTNYTSKLHFGARAKVSGRGVVSTPMVGKDTDTFYYLKLEGISVGNQRVEFYDPLLSNSKAAEEGNIVLDSGTTYTMLPSDFYNKLVEALKSSIELTQIEDPQGLFDLCYFSREDDMTIPDITVHFKGADVKWKQGNAFVRTSEDAICFAAQGVEDLAIYGNLAQRNFLVGYDLDQRTVSFKEFDCRNL